MWDTGNNPGVQFSVSRYVLAIGFFVAVVVFGLFSAMNLGVDLFPSVQPSIFSSALVT